MQSSGCVLEGIRGCGPVGEFWRESEGVVLKGLVGVVWR